MGYFNSDYPHTDFHELNLDWIISKIKEFGERIDNISSTIVTEANAYTDSQLASIRSDFDLFKAAVTDQLSDVDTKYANFTAEVNRRLLVMNSKLEKMQDTVDSTINVANAYTNQAIANNNEYIINETSKALSTVTVMNYFTGERNSIQAQFDYLAQFHLTNAITYGNLRDRQLTYQHLIDLAVTNSDVIVNGSTILV